MQCSVIIPAYNAAKTLPATLNSVLDSIETNDEILVIDDGSQDDTAQVCKNIDPRIKVKTIENCGPAGARNHGISIAQGELIAFCDADDRWHANKLSIQRRCFIDNTRLGLCFTDYQTVDIHDKVIVPSAIADRNLPTNHTLYSMLQTNPVCTSSAVARRSALQEVGCFPDTWSENLQLHLAGEDYEAWLAIAERYPIEMVPEVLLSYRKMPGSMFTLSANNSQASAELLKRRIGLVERTAKRNPGKVSLKQMNVALSEIYFRNAYNTRINGNYLNSAKLLIKSITKHPTRTNAYLALCKLPIHAILNKRQ